MKKLMTILLFAVFYSLSAQEPVNESESFDYYLELITELSSRSEEETDFNDLAYELYELWESPVDINTATPYDFGRLFWLSEYQLNNLISYVEKQKPMVSIYELAYVPGFDTSLVNSLKPFVRVTGNNGPSKYNRHSKHWIMARVGRTLENQKGSRENKFEGGAWKESFRYKYQYAEKVFAGFNLEKDAGESLFKGSNNAGPDFYSGYLKINDLGMFRTVCIGNYSVGFGQGLVAGPGFALGKSSQATNLIQKEAGIRPYTSNDENRYLQGVSTAISIRPFDFSVFLSYKRIDANITSKDSSGKILEVSSLQTTGYHSTSAEIDDENALGEFTGGGRLLFKKSGLQVGASFVFSEFEAKIVPRPANYNQFYFRGNRQSNFGVDFKFNFSNTTVFGEEAIDAGGNTAFLNGVTSNIGGRVQVSMLHRYYSRAYHAFYGNAFGENSRIQNEEGVYGGFRMAVAKHMNLGFYADFFRFPWLKFRVDAPSYGREFLVQTEYNPGWGFSAYLQCRYKQKQVNSADSSESTNSVIPATSKRVRLHISYQASSQLSLATRLEVGSYETGTSKNDKSFLLYQDFRYNFLKVPVQFNLRYALYETDSYDSRLYAYESDVLYAFSVNSYFSKGQRFYAMVKYSPFRMIDFWVKFSQSLYPDEKTISSGLYEIEGKAKNDVRLQVILKF